MPKKEVYHLLWLKSTHTNEIYLVNFVNNKAKWWYCVRYVRISLFLIICFSQGSVATRCRCGGKYNTDIVANLLPSTTVKDFKQELSYRKQIARQLRTQHVEGIYDNALKSRLTVTQGYWKRNHWVDHRPTRLTIRRVIGRWILSWPWNVGQRSLKVFEISAIRKLGCSFLFAFYSRPNYGRICNRLWDIQCQEWRDLENQLRGRSTSLKMAPFDRPYATFHWSAIVINIALSCTIFEFFTSNNVVTLKLGLEVTQGHWNWCHLKAYRRYGFLFAFYSITMALSCIVCEI